MPTARCPRISSPRYGRTCVSAFTYHSNAIEGNTLTMSETKAVLEDGITIGGKSLQGTS